MGLNPLYSMRQMLQSTRGMLSSTEKVIIQESTLITPQGQWTHHNMKQVSIFNADDCLYCIPPTVLTCHVSAMLLQSHIAQSFHINFPWGVGGSFCIRMGARSQVMNIKNSYLDVLEQKGAAFRLSFVWYRSPGSELSLETKAKSKSDQSDKNKKIKRSINRLPPVFVMFL